MYGFIIRFDISKTGSCFWLIADNMNIYQNVFCFEVDNSSRDHLSGCNQPLKMHFQVDHLAAGLLALGLKKGNRLGIWGPNTYEWILFQFATAKAGIIMVIM